MTDNDENDPAAPQFAFTRTDAHHLDVLQDGLSVATVCTARPGDYTLTIEPDALLALQGWNCHVLRILLTSATLRIHDLADALRTAGLPETEGARVIFS